MKVLVVYDSQFGNTKQVADAITTAIAGARQLPVNRVRPSDIIGLDRLIVGSPTHGGRPTQAILDFINKIDANAIAKTKVAAFDTRVLAQDQSINLRLVITSIGYAADLIASHLKNKTSSPVVGSEGFIVKAIKGPLKTGELERASQWAKTIIEL